MRKLNWHKIDKLLGTMPDRKLATKMGCNNSSITVRRNKLGIPSFFDTHIAVKWTTERIKLIGTALDKHIAKRLKISKWSVYTKRISLGIPSKFTKSLGRDQYNIDWEKADGLLGKVSDATIAKMFHCSKVVILDRRRKFNIKALRPGSVDWTSKDISLIGIMPDKDAAIKLGVSRGSVCYMRHKLGIPSPIPRSPGKYLHARYKVLNHKHLLGKISDVLLSKKLKVSRTLVQMVRMELNIGPYKKKRFIGVEHDTCRQQYARSHRSRSARNWGRTS